MVYLAFAVKGGTTMSSTQQRGDGWSRRTLIRRGAVATAAAGAASMSLPGIASQPAAAHNLPPGEFGGPAYDAALKAEGGMKGIFQSPMVEASTVAGEFLNHLLLVQLKNWMNGFQFSYEMDPKDLHTVSATYASANLLTYNDHVWETYKLGEKYDVIDPATGVPAVKNLFWPSRFGPDAPKDPAAKNNFYQDTGIEALQQRGTVFLT
jgi:hypothetical protein